jgi:hypothetical protein
MNSPIKNEHDYVNKLKEFELLYTIYGIRLGHR